MSTKRDITVDDLFRVKILNTPEISPAGDRIVFSYKWTDVKENKYFSNLYMTDVASGKTHPFTVGDQNDLHPCWSPDGKFVAFRSDRNGKRGLWIIPADGGEAVPLMTEKGTMGEYVWSPDSRHLAYTYRVIDEPLPVQHISGDPDFKPKGDERPYDVIDTIYYKTKDGDIKPKGKFHIYLINRETGDTIQLTEGEHDEGGLCFSPDGKTLAFCSAYDSDPIHDFEHNDIYLLDVASKKTTRLTKEWGTRSGLGFSDDGAFIYYTGNHAPKGEGGPEDQKLYRIPATGGEPHLLTGDFKGYVSNMLIGDTREFEDTTQAPLILDGGKTLAFTASYHGGCYIYEIPAEGGVPCPAEDGDVDISWYSLDSSRRHMAVLKGNTLSPNEIYHYERKDGKWEIRRLTSLNEFLKEETTISKPEEIWITTPEDVRVQGWLLKPPGFDPSKKYPLIHEIHGGPHILYGYTFFHEMQYYATKGYCVLYINPRGSKGYGRDFTAAVHKKWGRADMRDHMAFLDHVISLGFIDEKKIFVTGGSYGGYMTNWLVTQTNRYCAAASQRSVSNMISHLGVSAGNIHFEHTFGGMPWKDAAHLMDVSPLFHVENVETPLMIMHSENDHLCPIGEAEQFFVALKYLGRKARFVRFKDETHELSRSGRPTNRRARLELVMEWFEEFRK